MRLVRFSVEKLFGLFDHEIPFNLDERVTIIHAPNGFGKTVILKLIAGMFGGSLNVFRFYEFSSVSFFFDDNTRLEVVQGAREQELPLGQPQRETRSYHIDYVSDGERVSWNPDDRGQSVAAASPTVFERYIPHLIRVGPRQWRDNRYDDILGYSEVLDRYWGHLPPSARRQGPHPAWLQSIRTAIHCRLCTNDRHGSPRARAGCGVFRGPGAGRLPWRKRQAVASQGNEGAAARAAIAAPTEEDAENLADRRARLQGRGGARSLETGQQRLFPAPQDLSDLPVVGRSRAEIVGGRPSGAGRLLYDHARVDESQFRLLSCDQHRIPQQLRQGEQARRQLAHDPWRLLVERLLCHDRRTDQRDLCAGARRIARPAGVPGPGLSVPPDAGEPGAASQQPEPGVLENAQDRQRSLRDHASRTQSRRVRSALRVRCPGSGK